MSSSMKLLVCYAVWTRLKERKVSWFVQNKEGIRKAKSYDTKITSYFIECLNTIMSFLKCEPYAKITNIFRILFSTCWCFKLYIKLYNYVGFANCVYVLNNFCNNKNNIKIELKNFHRYKGMYKNYFELLFKYNTKF